MKLQCELWRMYKGIRDLLIDLDKSVGAQRHTSELALVKPSELAKDGELDPVSPPMSPRPLVKAKHVPGIVHMPTKVMHGADEAERAAGGGGPSPATRHDV